MENKIVYSNLYDLLAFKIHKMHFASLLCSNRFAFMLIFMENKDFCVRLFAFIWKRKGQKIVN